MAGARPQIGDSIITIGLWQTTPKTVWAFDKTAPINLEGKEYISLFLSLPKQDHSSVTACAIEDGNYRHTVTLCRQDEPGRPSSAFYRMTSSID
ncbi:MAG: hypothetical protein HQK56_16485 [Deltaproteobacteria bacterium]|nr:hypothetical protein [Deltaproteobacteria bacterium]